MEERVQLIVSDTSFTVKHTCGLVDALGVFAVTKQALVGPLPECVESIVITEFEPQRKICVAYNQEIHRYQIAVSGMKINEAIGFCEVAISYLTNLSIGGDNHDKVS